MLLFLKLLGQSIQEVWRSARSILDDEGLRTNLFPPIEPDIPDAYISLNHAEVPDPVTPAVLELVEKEQSGQSVGVRRLLFALRKRKAMLTTILRETYGAGFQRDEARVAARLGLRLNSVQLGIRDKKLVRV